MIHADSLQLRRAAIAYLFQNVIPPDRADNLMFYDAVQREGLEYTELQQHARELVLLRRASPEHLAEIRVGSLEVQVPSSAVPVAVRAPYRLLVAETASSKPFKFFRDGADTIYNAFHQVWGSRTGRLQLVEVSFIATVSIQDAEGAAGFVRDRVTRTSEAIAKHLGREFMQYGIKLGSGMTVVTGPGAAPGALPGAQIDLNLESNPQDPRLLVMQSVVKWQALQLPISSLPPQARETVGGRDLIEVNTDAQQPNYYLDQAYNYLTNNVLPFLTALSR